MPLPVNASREARRKSARAARTLSAMALVSACAAASIAHAQENNGPIVIAGPGEKNPADLQALAERINTPAPAAAPRASVPAPMVAPATLAANPRSEADRFAQAAHADGAIVIAGAGETSAQQGVAAAPANMNAGAPGMMRVSLQPASRQVMPVVVAPAQAVARPTAGVQPIAVNPAAGNAAAAQLRGAAAMPPAASQTPAQAAAQPAAPVPAGQQDGEAIRRAALAYLQQQSAGLPGKVDISVATVFPRGLAACTTLEPFLPTGARVWGRTTVGVRCSGERPWTLYLQAKVSIHATYFLASRSIAPGELLSAADLIARDGDLTLLPQAVITDPAQAVGSVSLMRVSAGLPLRRDMLKSADSVTIGQSVKVVAQGANFAISAEGSAMNNASPGQPVRVKTANGQIIQGIVKDGGTVVIQL
ncbi:flagella basal body P-ring formation protein FlgA [Burkholderia sp. YR290]|jgi:flagella basal body P-ring formation protein FlgA|uniref:Flagella basal body P-ring formation protein FlgA n=1 Tax=Paraburkholderia hospita TaxID=169430 RepID=A0ABP2PYK3_9BURK|nr:flagellar basal body P-ring formation chaperone FlgA [Paraburkholderia hospita]EIN02817.1 flagella basal body P-ring formation protein FlgA [Paraburkholderia hospita]OUL78061.1 flagella basal body P-ring formation protein FlgA [Paraburkholderia hospita]SKC64586.1 flagella basal body P-ring formation protein FlgA [Burkholderia sp. CF099]SOE60881.1 flagella basal body P-ring formation protein FlgA [Burkholderia sp. YR290]